MLIENINIRDPFILPDNGRYYMYGTRSAAAAGKGFDVYVSDSPEGDWDGPIEVFSSSEYGLDRGANWAPEVHFYNGSYYMFATFEQDNKLRGTYILRADKPDGSSLHAPNTYRNERPVFIKIKEDSEKGLIKL